MPEALPSYRELPIREGLPPKSAWGLFGDDDQLGTLNLLTPSGCARPHNSFARERSSPSASHSSSLGARGGAEATSVTT